MICRAAKPRRADPIPQRPHCFARFPRPFSAGNLPGDGGRAQIGSAAVRRALAVAAVALLAGCGESPRAAPPTPAGERIGLAIGLDDGAGRTASGRLACTPGAQRASGAIAGRVPAARLCARVRAIAELLTQPPPARRACTRIYGGPQTIRVTGTLDGRAVERRFTRRNGCELADYARVAGALSVRP